MSLTLIFLILFNSDPIQKSDKENQNQTVMNVMVEVVPGSLFIDQLTQNIRARSRDNSYQIGFKEFVITYPSQTEIIAGNDKNGCTAVSNCSSYIVTNIEKVDENTGKVRIHYLVGDKNVSNPISTSNNRQTATIIYL